MNSFKEVEQEHIKQYAKELVEQFMAVLPVGQMNSSKVFEAMLNFETAKKIALIHIDKAIELTTANMYHRAFQTQVRSAIEKLNHDPYSVVPKEKQVHETR